MPWCPADHRYMYAYACKGYFTCTCTCMKRYSPAQAFLITLESTPSDHSLVFKSNSPYSSPSDKDFGLIG